MEPLWPWRGALHGLIPSKMIVGTCGFSWVHQLSPGQPQPQPKSSPSPRPSPCPSPCYVCPSPLWPFALGYRRRLGRLQNIPEFQHCLKGENMELGVYSTGLDSYPSLAVGSQVPPMWVCMRPNGGEIPRPCRTEPCLSTLHLVGRLSAQ